MIIAKSLAILLSLLLLLPGAISCTTTTAASRNFNSSWLKPGLLNSDRIKEKFGSYGVQVLLQDERVGVRLSNLYSLLNGNKVMRTLALVNFSAITNDQLKKAHQEILDGASIGATLLKHGFTIEKNIIFKGLSDTLPTTMNEMMMTNQEQFATLVYDLLVNIDGTTVPYCTITEIYSDAFLSSHDIDHLYPAENILKKPSKVDENIEIIKAAMSYL